MGKSHLLSACLIVILIVSIIETYALIDMNRVNNILIEENKALVSKYSQLNATYNELFSSWKEINSSYTQLSLLHHSLNQSYVELKETFNSLNMSYNLLNGSYSGLSQNFSLLRASFDNLNLAYSELNLNYVQLNATRKELEQNYTTLETEYESLKSAYEALNTTMYASYVSAYQDLRFKVNFYVFHPKMEDKSLITPDDPTVKDKVQDITGGWSNPSDWNEFWTDVKAMYDWVVNNIEYRSDGLYPILPPDPNGSLILFDEMWQFPNQTLELGKGDCDDMATLLASMIYSYGDKQYYVECIVITGHAAVYIPVQGDKICILDPAGRYYTNTGFPFSSITTKDTNAEVHDWLNYWDTNNPENAPHVVKWIFSAYIYEYFDDTEAFINWLNNRL